MKEDFLVELGTEELPPKALARLADAFCRVIKEELGKANLSFSEAKNFAAPRRLAVLISQLDSEQADQVVERRGPALKAAFKEDGCPTPAAEGFAKSCGTTVDALETMETDKGAWLIYRENKTGAKATELLPEFIALALSKLPVPKRMRWGTNTHEFVRPVHWLLAIFGDAILETKLYGHQAGNTTFGHRFHAPDAITVKRPQDYVNLLETEGKVLVDYERRKETIRGQVIEAATNVGGVAVIDESLLQEVTGLVEWPVAVVGKFDDKFLEVPPEALVSAMKNHQKYFHLTDKKGDLLPYFITISNIESTNEDSVRQGNERVIRPRLSDADFFWQQDRKKRLEHYLPQLEKVVFQNKLGSVGDKTKRVSGVCQFLAEKLNVDSVDAVRAAELSKCDLMTGMVGEFPELQGTMGQYYARHQKESDSVAVALKEQYMPRFSGDDVPTTDTGAILSIGDKLDTTVGIFGIGQAPTGDKDPFALRRSIIGVLRIVIEKNLNVDIQELIETAVAQYSKGTLQTQTTTDVYQFMIDRLKGYYGDKGIDYDVFEAVAATRPRVLSDMDSRISAINAFKSLDEAGSLASANKRINNILKKSSKNEIASAIDQDLFSESAERALHGALEDAIASSAKFVEAKDYEKTLKILATLKGPVDEFFDNVMVNSEDKAQKANRLALLSRLAEQFLSIADIGQLQIK